MSQAPVNVSMNRASTRTTMLQHPPMIRDVVVGVPAQNEERRVGASIESLLVAAAAIEPQINVHIAVAADCCTDGTVAVVTALAAEHRRIRLVTGRWGTAGGARRAALAEGIVAATSAEDPVLDQIWVSTTDADTVVPADWLSRQISYAQRGFDAVAGVVDLIHDDDVEALVIERFADLYRFDEHESHSHVHGANLGVRASAYLAAGGFPEVACSEDHALWNELRAHGFACVSPIDVRVLTSARLRSRAPGGFADTLAAIVAAERQRADA